MLVRVLLACLGIALLMPAASSQMGAEVASSSNGGGWVALQTESFGPDSFRFELIQEEHESTLLGLELRSAAGGAVQFMKLQRDQATEIAVGPPGLHFHTNVTGEFGTWRLVVNVHVSEPSGPVQALFWVAGTAAQWHWAIRSNTTWIEAGRGGDAYFWRGEQVGEGHHLRAAFQGNGATVTDARYPFRIEQEFRGLAGYRQPGLTEGSTIEMLWPDGRTETCPCSFWGSRGEHVLRWEGVDIRPQSGMPVLLAGVDAPTWATPSGP